MLKKDYPQQILEKYRSELNKMASYSGDRKKYRTLVSLLCSLKIQGWRENSGADRHRLAAVV